MSDRCKVKIVPDEKLGFKLIIKGCETELEEIRKKTGAYTQKWVDERTEIHEWIDDEEKSSTENDEGN